MRSDCECSSSVAHLVTRTLQARILILQGCTVYALLVSGLCGVMNPIALGQDSPVEKTMAIVLNAASGRTKNFQSRAVIQVPLAGQTQEVMIDVQRDGANYDMSIVSKLFSMVLRRRDEGTALAIPNHKVVFLGKEAVTTQDSLDFNGLSVRLISGASQVGNMAPMLLQLDPAMVLNMAKSAMRAKVDDAAGTLSMGGIQIRVTQPGQIAGGMGEIKMRVGVKDFEAKLPNLEDWPGYRVESVERNELEQTLARAVRRVTEMIMPGDGLLEISGYDTAVDNGEIKWIEGQRVVLLRGTPEQIGRAHGELMNWEVHTSIDTLVNCYGLAESLRNGKWFGNELRQRFAKLKPSLPEQFVSEMQALADAVQQPVEAVIGLNLLVDTLPGSGFAIGGTATTEGILHHGRTWDFMALLGLQDAAVTYVISPTGRTPIVYVGFAGQVGCLAGMNDAQLSVGELVRHAPVAEGDGMPRCMFTRQALEESTSLEQLEEFWSKHTPNGTSDYILADGKSGQMVVAASRSGKIRMVKPGEHHPLLATQFVETALLPADDRWQPLTAQLSSSSALESETIGELLGKSASASDNLQNVLFVPGEGTLYVAHATRRQRAAELPYVRIEARQLIAAPLTPKPQ
ncbi:MAG: hypothetical protein KF752_16250 [Pirellulaceae bacterium]|nr:hypothetical protein [Pirellulaceae bacterium]